jgi:hypothetical protein
MNPTARWRAALRRTDTSAIAHRQSRGARPMKNRSDVGSLLAAGPCTRSAVPDPRAGPDQAMDLR